MHPFSLDPLMFGRIDRIARCSSRQLRLHRWQLIGVAGRDDAVGRHRVLLQTACGICWNKIWKKLGVIALLNSTVRIILFQKNVKIWIFTRQTECILSGSCSRQSGVIQVVLTGRWTVARGDRRRDLKFQMKISEKNKPHYCTCEDVRAEFCAAAAAANVDALSNGDAVE